jgi:hypothetical protein
MCIANSRVALMNMNLQPVLSTKMAQRITALMPAAAVHGIAVGSGKPYPAKKCLQVVWEVSQSTQIRGEKHDA